MQPLHKRDSNSPCSRQRLEIFGIRETRYCEEESRAKSAVMRVVSNSSVLA
jgi:hypothetical protein